jgi:hypothetical protein
MLQISEIAIKSSTLSSSKTITLKMTIIIMIRSRIELLLEKYFLIPKLHYAEKKVRLFCSQDITSHLCTRSVDFFGYLAAAKRNNYKIAKIKRA